MPSRDPAARTRVIVEAVAASHQRAMLSSGWAQLGQSELPATCKVVGALNHQRLFPRLAAIVHHGGAGTTSSAVRAGVPQVIVPHMFDRPYWAARVQALGVAPPPVAKSFTARSLAAGIHHATSTPALTESARLLRDQVAGVNGVTEAVRFLSSQASRLS